MIMMIMIIIMIIITIIIIIIIIIIIKPLPRTSRYSQNWRRRFTDCMDATVVQQ